MVEQDALLATIAAHPTDDLPRLIFADYLEEHGQAERAEFIRAQVQLARITPRDADYHPLQSRCSQLLEQYRDAWRYPGLRGHQDFRRGFVESLWTTAERLIQDASAFAVAHTIHEIRISNMSGHIADLLNVSGLHRVSSLDLSNNSMGTRNRMQQLFRGVALPRLRSLTLRVNNLDSDDLLSLADTPVAAQLTHLDLSGNPLGNSGAEVLATEPVYRELHWLSVRADELPHYDCMNHNAGESLADSKTLRQLHTLDIGDHYLGATGVMALFNSPVMATIHNLNIAYNEIRQNSYEVILSLIRSHYTQSLRQLRWDGNWFHASDAENLLRWPQLKLMEEVSLRECNLDRPTRELLQGHPLHGKFVYDPHDVTEGQS